MKNIRIATHLGFKLAQVEWSFALLLIINDLTDLSSNEKRKLLEGVCGSPPNKDWSISWGEIWDSWSGIDVSDNVLQWLITGLNADATEKISEILSEFQSSQATLEQQNQNDEHHYDQPLVIPQPLGDLIIQVYSHTHLRWEYHTPNKIWYLSNIKEEPSLIASIISSLHSNRPIGIARIHQESPSTNLNILREAKFNNLHIQEQNTLTLTLGTMIQHQSIDINVPGGFTTPFPLSKTASRSIQESFQKTIRWSITLESIGGPKHPLVWNLDSTLIQTATGNGGYGGNIQFRNSAFTQLTSGNQWLDGTDVDETLSPFPQKVLEQVDSRRSIWLAGDDSIDYSTVASNVSGIAEPIFEETPNLNHLVKKRTYIKGSGSILTAEMFIEMNLKCEQTDLSKRTDMKASNEVSWILSGSIEWCGNRLEMDHFSEHFDISWSTENKNAYIQCQTLLPKQSVERRVRLTEPENEETYYLRNTHSPTDSQWQFCWDEFVLN